MSHELPGWLLSLLPLIDSKSQVDLTFLSDYRSVVCVPNLVEGPPRHRFGIFQSCCSSGVHLHGRAIDACTTRGRRNSGEGEIALVLVLHGLTALL